MPACLEHNGAKKKKNLYFIVRDHPFKTLANFHSYFKYCGGVVLKVLKYFAKS